MNKISGVVTRNFLCWGGVLAGLGLCGHGQGQVGPALPPAPRSFEAVAASSHEIHCYWLPAEGATGYRLQRDGHTIATLPASARDYTDKDLAPSAVHHYTLQALQNEAISAVREDVDETFTPLQADSSTGGTEPAAQNNKLSAGSAKGSRRGAVAINKRVCSFDVVIVQASSGGVAAAIEAARRGLKVALIEPSTRLGGMPVNGLSSTDLRRDTHASGFLVRFAERVRQLYAVEGVKTDGLRYEPRIAHMAMKALVFEQPNITLYRHARLAAVVTKRSDYDATNEALNDSFDEEAEENSKGRRRVASVQIEEIDAAGQPTGARCVLQGKTFIDATDCGDLAALAGAKYRLGREARSKAEPHNGVIYYNRQADSPLPGSSGAGDRRIQAYAYLFVVKDYGPNADKTIPKPEGYRREDFIHSPAWRESWAFTSGKLPQNKYELNQHPQGGDIQEINYSYPTDNYAHRATIEKLYRDHVLGYLYYIQTELGQKQLGLPDDEYRDTGGFPPLLYVREGRRIVGEQLPVEADITNALSFARPESIGIGDYPMDSHAVRVKTDWNRPDMGEGEWWLYKETPWHQLPLGIIIPRGLDNVFVTTAVSSTHVSFGTYRLEAVRMEFGQAAAIASDLCIRYHICARDVPARQVQDEILPHAANLHPDPSLMLTYLSDVKPTHRHYRAIEYLVARGFSFATETFKPNAPTTGKEFARMLQKLAERAAPPPHLMGSETLRDGVRLQTFRRAYYPYMGTSANLIALQECLQTLNTDTPVTRASVAHWLAHVLNWQKPSGSGSHYADIPSSADISTSPATTSNPSGSSKSIGLSVPFSSSGPSLISDVEALYAHNIDSEIWDGLGHRTPDGKLTYKPEAPLSHADLFATLFLAQTGLGPLFNDNPADGKNGRSVPSALYETVTIP